MVDRSRTTRQAMYLLHKARPSQVDMMVLYLSGRMQIWGLMKSTDGSASTDDRAHQNRSDKVASYGE
jgi:hypothetical protein